MKVGDQENLNAAYDRGIALQAASAMRERAARLAETYNNGQFTEKDTWAEGFAFAKRMIAANIRGLPLDL